MLLQETSLRNTPRKNEESNLKANKGNLLNRLINKWPDKEIHLKAKVNKAKLTIPLM